MPQELLIYYLYYQSIPTSLNHQIGSMFASWNDAQVINIQYTLHSIYYSHIYVKIIDVLTIHLYSH